MWFIDKKLEEFKGLEEKLRKLSDISISEDRKTEIKRNIIVYTKSRQESEEFLFAGLIEKIKQIAQKLNPSLYFRTLLKEKLMTVAEFQKPSRFYLIFRNSVYRKAFAAFVAVLFVATALFQFTFKIEKAQASFLTSLGEINGDVVVFRGSEEIKGAPGLLLSANDVVRTGPASKAVIKFLDQSVSRLDENTEVKIAKLFVNPSNKTETIVELVLNHGRLWSRVVNLIDNISRFQVKAKNTMAVAKKKAAFDVSVQAKKAKVSAIANGVDVVVATDKKVVETTLVKGFTAEVKTTVSSQAPTIAPTITKEKSTPQDNQWVAENLAKDEQYIQEVKQEAQEQIKDQVKVLPGNPLYAVKELSETTKIALTLDEYNRQQKILVAAQEKLAEAEVFLESGQTEKALPLISEFQNQIQAITQWLKDYEIQHPAEGAEFRLHIADVLNLYQKQLTLVLPTDPLYKLKEAVGQAQLISASGKAEETQEKLSQASDRLLEAHDLAEQGNVEAAAQQVQAYSQAISDVVSEIKVLPGDAKEQAVTVILDNKMEDLKMLEAITSPTLSGTSSLVGTNTAVTAGTTTKEAAAAPILNQISGTATPLDLVATSTALSSAEITEPEVSVTPLLEKQLKETVNQAKTEALTKIGEAVLEVQNSNAPKVEVLQKLEDIKKMDVNGKLLMNVTVTTNKVLIKTDGTVISVTGTSTQDSTRPSAPENSTQSMPQPQKADLKTPVLPQARP